MEPRLSHSLPTESTPSAEHLPEDGQDREVPMDNFSGPETPLTGIKTIDQIDLLREQLKVLSGEVALHTSALKRLSEEVIHHPRKELIQEEIRNLNDEIKKKNEQIASLEKQIADSILRSDARLEKFEPSQPLPELLAQLNEKSFELEVKAADNRIIQEQINQRTLKFEELQETVASLKRQLSDALEQRNLSPLSTRLHHHSEIKSLHGELLTEKEVSLVRNTKEALALQVQENEIQELKKKVDELTKAKEQLELRNQKLAEESLYAKGLASAAAVELKALSEEVAKLMNHNERLAAELAAQKSSLNPRRTDTSTRNGRRDGHVNQGALPPDIKRELALSRERELAYEAALAEKDQTEAELQSMVEESTQRVAYLENELANMWVLVVKLKRSQGAESDVGEAEN